MFWKSEKFFDKKNTSGIGKLKNVIKSLYFVLFQILLREGLNIYDSGKIGELLLIVFISLFLFLKGIEILVLDVFMLFLFLIHFI